MLLSQLEHFKKVAELQHITKASEQLYIAQPSLSRSISNLEEELNCKLFNRKGKNIILNKYGEAVLIHANNILRERDSIKKHLIDLSSDAENTVSVSVFSALNLMPNLIMQFRQQYPSIKLKLIQKSANQYAECDISIYSGMHSDYGENKTTLLCERIYLAVPCENPLSLQPILDLSQVKNEGFICVHKGNVFRNLMDEYCQMAGFTPNVILESDNSETVRMMIHAGIGVAFFPGITWGRVSEESLRLVPIRYPEMYRYVNIKWQQAGHITTASKIFKDFTIAYFKELTLNRECF